MNELRKIFIIRYRVSIWKNKNFLKMDNSKVIHIYVAIVTMPIYTPTA